MSEQNGAATLGEYLKQLRALYGHSLRAVGDATGFSSAYLLKLERDEVKTPSPHLLRALAAHFTVSYESLLDLAGYAPGGGANPRRVPSPIADALAGQDFTEAEQQAIAAFLAGMRASRTE